jgi:outer membrane lipoprotein-sorting protein
MSPWFAVLAAYLFSCHPPGPAGVPTLENSIRGEERIRLLDGVQARQREVTTVRATVVQRKSHPLLKAEAVSQGILLFQRPDRVRWEVHKPERTIIVIAGDTLLTYRPDRREAEFRDLRDDFGGRAAVEFFTAGLSLAVGALEKRFHVDVYRENGQLVLLLTPRTRWVARAVSSIAISQDAEDAVPRQIVVVGQKGDCTQTTLTEVTINPRFAEDPFTLQLGPDVRVTDVRKPAGETDSGR